MNDGALFAALLREERIEYVNVPPAITHVREHVNPVRRECWLAHLNVCDAIIREPLIKIQMSTSCLLSVQECCDAVHCRSVQIYGADSYLSGGANALWR
jgi:hypothetical protein